jgi:hypothetical protein
MLYSVTVEETAQNIQEEENMKKMQHERYMTKETARQFL